MLGRCPFLPLFRDSLAACSLMVSSTQKDVHLDVGQKRFRICLLEVPVRFRERFLEESLPLIPSHDVLIVGLPLDLQIRVESCIDRQEGAKKSRAESTKAMWT